MEQAGPYLCFIYFGLNFLRSQFAFTQYYPLISAVQNGCSYSIIFKFVLLLQWTLTFWYQNPSPANVNSIATSRVVSLEEIWTLPCVTCIFNSVSVLCAIFSPLPQVHCMVSVASCSYWMNSTAWQGGQKYICWLIKETKEWTSWLYDNKTHWGLESPIPSAYRRL